MTTPTTRRPISSVQRLMAWVAGMAVVFAVLTWAGRAGIWWWASQAVEASCYFFPRLARAAGAASIVALIAAVADRRVWRLRSLWMLSPLAVPILLLAFGIVFRNSGVAREWPALVIGLIPWLLLPLGFTLLDRFRSASEWIIILGISTAAAWFSIGCQLISVMSVTNDWL
ncbi:hypothetical protein [Paludisphaera rhizosphaerae]|uniref:hypothetical protein n=1 Tax=Paludisphaera rhizosphaerae TaxID=2711216 RepID=UPI0013EA0C0A|nr:hypothetical protein [Paludisphaera rhizosphaerae]